MELGEHRSAQQLLEVVANPDAAGTFRDAQVLDESNKGVQAKNGSGV